MIRELDRVALTVALPEHGLEPGDVGTVVMVYGDGRGYEVEFLTLGGETVAVETLLPEQVRPVGRWEVTHARPVVTAAGKSADPVRP